MIRRSDGFEARKLVRCGRCRVVVGYEIDNTTSNGKGREDEAKVLYIIPGGLMSTEVMSSGKKLTEGDVEMKPDGIAAWE
jgi:hypothetical protein